MNGFRIASTAFGAFVLLAPLGSAQARIECDGNFQVGRGGQTFSSPYCQEQNLARVAQGYGIRVSAQAIRESDSVKGQVCRTIGHDMRVRDTCLMFRNEGGPVDRR